MAVGAPAALPAGDAQLFKVSFGGEGGSFEQLTLVAEGPVSASAAAAGTDVALVRVSEAAGIQLKRGATISVSRSPASGGSASPREQWTIQSSASEGECLALVFAPGADTSHLREWLACELAVAVESSDAGEHGPGQNTVAAAIEATGRLAATALLSGASVLGAGLGALGRAVQSSTSAAAADAPVSERTSRALDSAQAVGSATLRASTAVLSTTTYVIKSVGRVTADQIRGTAFYQQRFGGSEPSDARAKAAAEVGSAVVTATMGVYHAAKRATRIVADDAKDAAVGVATHRLGAQHGQSVRRGLDAVDDVATAALQATLLVSSPDALAVELAIESADHTFSHDEWFQSEPVLQGELWRRSALTGLWPRAPQRAVLRAKCLALYDGAASADERACVVVAVEDMGAALSCEPDAGGAAGACVFELRTRDHVRHFLRAADEAARARWIEALSEQIAKCPRTRLLEGRAYVR